MADDISIAHEFYKIRNRWKTIDHRTWNMMIWVVDYQDIDILDKFMEIEASPIGIFDSIFFRLQTLFSSKENFEKEVWEEFLGWFTVPEQSEYDLIGAMKEDGYLDDDYAVNSSLPPTFDSLIIELQRLKNILPFKEENFILYFPPGLHEPGFQQWFSEQLQKELPPDIRLATIDPIGKRVFDKLVHHKTAVVQELSVDLNMAAAMKNAMNQDSDESRPHTPTARFQKQVRTVMEATVDDELSVQDESEILIELGYQLNMLTSKATAHLVSAIAFFSQKEDEEALDHVNMAIEMTEAETEAETEAYPIWRSSTLLKAALVLAKKKKDIALSCYQDIADKGVTQGDIFYVMEAYRMKAFIYFQSKKLDSAWEAAIYSLQAGTNLPLEIRRGSTFLYSAAIAYQIANDNNSKEEIILSLEQRFKEQIGDDWDTLLKGTETIDIKYMNKRNWLNFNKLLEWA